MRAAEVTQAETSERARLLRVRAYAVALDLTRGDDIFNSICVVRFDCAERGAASYIDLVAEAVHEITLNGEPLDPATAWAEGRIMLPALAARNELRVAADCAYTSSGTGMHRSADSAGGVYIYGKLAQAYARTAYACFDQPDLKAEFTFSVTAPAGWTVLSNQPAAGAPEPAGDSLAVWRFLATPPLPTFTTTVVAGDYHLVTESHTTPGGQRIPLELACRAGLADRLDSETLFEVTRHGLDYYTDVLGAEYPYAKYGQVFVPRVLAEGRDAVQRALCSRALPDVAVRQTAREMAGGRRAARAILIDDLGRLVLIKRTKPGQPPYWTTPGGGVEDGESVEAALHRELAEELGAEATGASRVFLHSSPSDSGVAVQYFFVARLAGMDEARRSGPELTEPGRGEYAVDRVDLTGDDLAGVDLKPGALKEFILANREALLAEAAAGG